MFDRLGHAPFHDSCSILQVHLLMTGSRAAHLDSSIQQSDLNIWHLSQFISNFRSVWSLL